MKAKPARAEQTDLHEKCIALLRRIQAWREVQMVYMPCVASLLSSSPNPGLDEIRTDASSTERVENITLFLPSSLPTTLPPALRAIGISPDLLEKEIKLRIAQADDALAELHRQRRIVTGLVLFKKLNISGTGQKKNTRLRTLFKRFKNTTERAAERYRTAHRVLTNVDPEGSWRTRLQVLHAEDIRGPGREDFDKHDCRLEVSERQREQSWIWLVPRVETAPDIGVMEEYLDANLHVEWAKSRARAARWTEEVDLVVEEMRRTLAFFEWKARWWRNRTCLRLTESDDLRHGIDAYAEKQAALLDRRATNYAQHWLPILKAQGITPCWEGKYRIGGHHVPVVDGQDDENAEKDDVDGDDSEVEQDAEITEVDVYDKFEIDI
jgi:hypothetical protein